ncbi:hypothetical protein MATL_G00066860 [Megalops atlanticus]|uniref:Uncharacterized protein n=1 Tax=Megalops atlanticus TaxID=7932 RepID=A0A9D3TDW8_MEGAT|nr:hypothetical protein MATL_G00066860 [Megalops atlanticus]
MRIGLESVFLKKQVCCALSFWVGIPRHCSPGSASEDNYATSFNIKLKPAMEASVEGDGCRSPLLVRPDDIKSTFLSRDTG